MNSDNTKEKRLIARAWAVRSKDGMLEPIYAYRRGLRTCREAKRDAAESAIREYGDTVIKVEIYGQR